MSTSDISIFTGELQLALKQSMPSTVTLAVKFNTISIKNSLFLGLSFHFKTACSISTE